jgi:hypothetical protein
MFQSFDVYFQKYKRTLVRLQTSDPKFIASSLATIFQEQQIPIIITTQSLTIQNNIIVMRGLSGGARHIFSKQKNKINQEISLRTGGVIVEVRLG